MTVRVAVIGECMLELKGEPFGAMTMGYGGDTFNTAVYLARCGARAGIEVEYATALGEDALSRALVTQWQRQGVGTRLVRHLAGRMPGLYMIEVDPNGERSFHYWRDTAAAKAYFATEPPSLTPLESHANEFNAFYFSGITLAILPPDGRERLLALMATQRARGAQVIFDNNYRPRLWPDHVVARNAFQRAFAVSSIALITADDHQALFGATSPDEAIARAKDLPVAEIVIKRGASPTLVRAAVSDSNAAGDWNETPTERVARVIDTTAAGDAFAGAYLARRLAGAEAVTAAAHGNRVAARVIQHPGAIIPAEAMADLTAA